MVGCNFQRKSQRIKCYANGEVFHFWCLYYALDIVTEPNMVIMIKYMKIDQDYGGTDHC